MLVPRNVRVDLFCIFAVLNKQKRKTPNRNVTVYVQKKTQRTARKECCAAVPGVEGGCCGRLVGRETGPTSVCANTFSLPTCSIQQLDQSPRASNYDAPLSLPVRLARVGICCQECKHPKKKKKPFRKKASPLNAAHCHHFQV